MKYLKKYEVFTESKSLMYFDAIEAEEAFTELARSGKDVPDAIPTNVREWHKFTLQIDRISTLLKATKENTILEVFFGNNYKENLPQICYDCCTYDYVDNIWILRSESDKIINNYIINGIYDPSCIYEDLGDFHGPYELKNYKRSVIEVIQDMPYEASEAEHILFDCGLPIRSLKPMISKIYHALNKAITEVLKKPNGTPYKLKKSKEDSNKYILETKSEAPKTNSYLLVYGKEVKGKRRLYVAKIKGGGSYKRQNADTRMAHLSQDELYIVKEKEGKLIASRCATTNAEKFMGLSSWNVALNDNKTPYHWAAMKYKTAQEVVKELTTAIREMPNINLD